MVSNTDFEHQWSIALKKGKQQADKQAQVPLDIQKKQLTEEMTYYKTKLRQNLKAGHIPDVEKTLKTLMELRGKQVGVKLQAVEKKFGTLPKEYIKYYCQQYIKDCTGLVASAQALLSKRI